VRLGWGNSCGIYRSEPLALVAGRAEDLPAV